MADINIANLPDSPLPILDGDFIHTSQSGTDFKIVMTDLADRFNLVDIFGLTQSTTPASGNFVPISTSGTIDGNRRVSLFNMGKLYQANEFFVSSGSIVLTDETLWRDGGIETLEQTTFQEVRDLTLNMNVGFSGHPFPLTTDRYVVFDSVATEAKFITGIDLQGEMTDPSNFSALPSAPLAEDAFIIREDSTNLSRSITFATLESAIAGSVDVSNLVDLTSTQNNISGTKTFTSATGIKTDKLVEATSNAGVTIEGVRCENNSIESVVNVQATGFVNGNFRGTGGNASNLLNVLNQTNVQIHNFATSTNFNNASVETGIYSLCTTDKGFVPDNDNLQVLGSKSRRWKHVSSGHGFFNTLVQPLASAGSAARLSSAFYLDDVLMTSGSGTSTKIKSSVLPAASTSVSGISELATDTEARAGTATTRALTPDNLSGLTNLSAESITVFVVGPGNKTMIGFAQATRFGNHGIFTASFFFNDDTNYDNWSTTLNHSTIWGDNFATLFGANTHTVQLTPIARIDFANFTNDAPTLSWNFALSSGTETAIFCEDADGNTGGFTITITGQVA